MAAAEKPGHSLQGPQQNETEFQVTDVKEAPNIAIEEGGGRTSAQESTQVYVKVEPNPLDEHQFTVEEFQHLHDKPKRNETIIKLEVDVYDSDPELQMVIDEEALEFSKIAADRTRSDRSDHNYVDYDDSYTAPSFSNNYVKILKTMTTNEQVFTLYKCALCVQIWNDLAALLLHTGRAHTEGVFYTVEHRARMTEVTLRKAPKQYAKLISVSPSLLLFKCPKCTVCYSNRRGLALHSEQMHAEAEAAMIVLPPTVAHCQQCDCTFLSASDFQNHAQSLTCRHCKMSFFSCSQLHFHVLYDLCVSTLYCPCGRCGATAQMSAHLLDCKSIPDGGRLVMYCPCGLEDSWSVMVKHKKFCNFYMKTYICAYCDSKFFKEFSLKDHCINIHKCCVQCAVNVRDRSHVYCTKCMTKITKCEYRVDLKEVHSTEAECKKDFMEVPATEADIPLLTYYIKKDLKEVHSTDAECKKDLKQVHATEAECRKDLKQVHSTEAVCKKDFKQVHSTEAECKKDFMEVPATEADIPLLTYYIKKDLKEVHSTDAECKKDLKQVHATEAECRKDLKQVHSIEAECKKDFKQVHSTEAECKKDFMEVPATEAECEKEAFYKRKYMCGTCSTEFDTSSGICKRMCTEIPHTCAVPKIFTCVCKKGFLSRRLLMQHEIESELKNEICRKCDMRLVSECHRLMHNEVCTGGRWLYPCRHCHTKFSKKEFLLKHLATCSPVVKEVRKTEGYLCDICDIEFRQENALRQHYRRVHPVTVGKLPQSTDILRNAKPATTEPKSTGPPIYVRKVLKRTICSNKKDTQLIKISLNDLQSDEFLSNFPTQSLVLNGQNNVKLPNINTHTDPQFLKTFLIKRSNTSEYVNQVTDVSSTSVKKIHKPLSRITVISGASMSKGQNTSKSVSQDANFSSTTMNKKQKTSDFVRQVADFPSTPMNKGETPLEYSNLVKDMPSTSMNKGQNTSKSVNQDTDIPSTSMNKGRNASNEGLSDSVSIDKVFKATISYKASPEVKVKEEIKEELEDMYISLNTNEVFKELLCTEVNADRSNRLLCIDEGVDCTEEMLSVGGSVHSSEGVMCIDEGMWRSRETLPVDVGVECSEEQDDAEESLEDFIANTEEVTFTHSEYCGWCKETKSLIHRCSVLKKTYSCNMCKVSSNALAEYFRHYQNHNVPVGTCPCCSLFFGTKALGPHIKRYLMRNYSCKMADLNRKYRNRVLSKMYPCGMCGEKVHHVSLLSHWERHILDDLNNVPLKEIVDVTVNDHSQLVEREDEEASGLSQPAICKDEEVDDLSQPVKCKDNKVDDLSQPGKCKDNKVDDLSQPAKCKDYKVNDLSQPVKCKDNKVDDLSQPAKCKDNKVDDLSQPVKFKNEKINYLTQAAKRKDKNINNISQPVICKDEKVDGLTQRVECKNEKVDDLTQPVKSKDEKINKLTQVAKRKRKRKGKKGVKNIRNISQIVKCKDEKVDYLSQPVICIDEKVDDLSQPVICKDEKVGDLSQPVICKDEKVDDLSQPVICKDEKVGDLSQPVICKDEKMDDLSEPVNFTDGNINGISLLECTNKTDVKPKIIAREAKVKPTKERHGDKSEVVGSTSDGHTDSTPSKNLRLNKEVLSSLLKQLADRRRKGPKICSYCKKCFNRNSDLKRHVIEHVVDHIASVEDFRGIYQCDICAAVFLKVFPFKKHMREHARLPLYQCELCDKAFSDSSNFSKHKKVHGIMYMQCDTCRRKFTSRKMLLQHMEFHSKSEPLPCDECDRIFYFASTLRKHKQSHDPRAVSFKCAYCPRVFPNMKGKWDHQWLEHSVRKFTADCPICDEGYRNTQQLRVHVRSAHAGSLTAKEKQKVNSHKMLCSLKLWR